RSRVRCARGAAMAPGGGLSHGLIRNKIFARVRSMAGALRADARGRRSGAAGAGASAGAAHPDHAEPAELNDKRSRVRRGLVLQRAALDRVKVEIGID